MPIHDWTRVPAGIFHHFHHSWIEEIQRALNSGILPDDYYALAEQDAAAFGPDVLTLQASAGVDPDTDDRTAAVNDDNGLLVASPNVRVKAETDLEFYRRKQKVVAVRHVSGDTIVAIVEVVSPGNKAGRKPWQSFIDKAAKLLDKQIHLLILDLHPPGRRDRHGVHGALWEELTGEEYTAPKDKPLTLAAYESELTVRAYVEPTAVGDVLVDMPLFLEPGAHVLVPLEPTYEAAWRAVPRRWQRVLQAEAS